MLIYNQFLNGKQSDNRSMALTSLSLSNVVFHFKLKEEESASCLQRFKREEEESDFNEYYIKFYHNFCVIKKGKLSFIYFFTSGHVNCTGTRTLCVIKDTLLSIKSIFRIKIKGRSLKISNTTWSGRCLSDKLDILSLVNGQIRVPEHWKVSLRPGSFPAALIRQEVGPSAVLFKNGKYIIVGAIKKAPVKKLGKEIEATVLPICPR